MADSPTPDDAENDDGKNDDGKNDEGELRDALPEDLDARGMVGPYTFPDNSRRRTPGALYLALAAVCLVLWLVRRSDQPVLVNDGYVLAAALLGALGVFCFTSGWKMRLDEKQALESATAAVGFPVGHASAQLAWRGLRSRPTWRILCYSAEEPPRRRGFVLIDAVDGRTVEHLVEDNPEDWDAVTKS
jgi:hypothetical protein